MITKVLIANRGEIACRVMHTAKRLGIKTVAIYAPIDKSALHVKQADEAYAIEDLNPTQSYLNQDKIIEIAKLSGAQAIHPGYGFLSENAGFAERCAQEDLVFMGPSAAAIRMMGSKSESKSLMEKVGVPTTPGYHGTDQSLETLTKEAARIGYPIMIKASAGGGGKGMRIVRDAPDFEEAIGAAKREVLSAFGDDRLLLEKYIEAPRHIEVQIFGDHMGDVVHLFTRDCSIQRRYQKVVEEAPALNISEETLDKIHQAALVAAKSVNYVGAGTVEFLMGHDEQFYFMEMNTRLQVEHPVTEMITNQDLVAWQFKVASKKALPLKQSEIICTGHAVEVRICAENPKNNFMPATGTLSYISSDIKDNTRIDIGVTQGDSLSVYYDSLIAKLIAWGEDRAAAIKNLKHLMKDFDIGGVKTNTSYLRNIINHERFNHLQPTTDFIDAHHERLVIDKKPGVETVAFAHLTHVYGDRLSSHWTEFSYWRMNASQKSHSKLKLDVYETEATLSINAHKISVTCEEQTFDFCFSQGSDSHTSLLGPNNQLYYLIQCPDDMSVFTHTHDGFFSFDVVPLVLKEQQTSQVSNQVKAPMPGKIIDVKVQNGDMVETGDVLILMEAMKMEHSLKSPLKGDVQFAHTLKSGDLVQEGQVLVSLMDADIPSSSKAN